MNIVQSWKESLRLLRPENLKPFLMVTAKTVLDVYKTIDTPLTSRGNWILLGIVGLLILMTNTLKLFNLFWLEALLLNAIRFSLVFLFALALRPSTDQKTVGYFQEKINTFWYVMIAVVILGMIGVLAFPFVNMYMLFFLFAAFDSHGTMNELMTAFRTAFLMIFYNLPLCACAYLVLGAINVLLYYLIGFVLGYFGGLTLAVFLCIVIIPIEVALIANLYIKFIHGQPSLYFKQPE